MSPGTKQLDPDHLLAALKADPQGLSWPRRRQIAQSLGPMLVERNPSASTLPLLELLATDPKHEVRLDVANVLPLVLDRETFVRLAAKLTADPNAFVRRAAERAVRQRSHQDEAEASFNSDPEVYRQYAQIEQRWGSEAACCARQLAEQFTDQLIHAWVHNIRGALTSLTADAAQLRRDIQQEPLSPESLQDRARHIQERLKYLTRLVEDMRTYAQSSPEPREHQVLAELVREAVRMAQQNVQASGSDVESVELSVEVPPELAIPITRHQMLTALTNVVKNAYEALDGRSCRHITIRTVRNPKTVKILVQDSGMGLSDRELKELLEFVPGSRTSKRNRGGTGYGLPNAHKHVQAHGGRLGIQSREGEGTTVTIELPIGDNDAEES